MTNIRNWKLFFLLVAMFVGSFCYLWYMLLPELLLSFKEKSEDFVASHFERKIEYARIQGAWQPPPEGAEIDHVFPKVVGDYKRSDVETSATLSQFDIPTAGRHAVYTSGERQVDVYAFRIADEQRVGVFSNIVNVIEQRRRAQAQHVRVKTSEPKQDQFRYSMRPPVENGIFWWRNGWLLHLHNSADFDLEPFLVSYLKRLQTMNKYFEHLESDEEQTAESDEGSTAESNDEPTTQSDGEPLAASGDASTTESDDESQ